MNQDQNLKDEEALNKVSEAHKKLTWPYNTWPFNEEGETEPQEPSLLKKIKGWFILIVLSVVWSFFFIESKQTARQKKGKKALKKKLKYFNPIVKEGLFSNTVTWVGRDKPLSDDEVEELIELEY